MDVRREEKNSEEEEKEEKKHGARLHPDEPTAKNKLDLQNFCNEDS